MSADETLESPVAIAAPLFRKRVRKGPGRANGRSKPVESQPAPGSDSDLSDAESEAAASAAEERKKKRLNNDRNPLFQRSTRRAKDSTTAATAVDANAPTTTSIQDPVPGTAANFNGGDTQQKEKDQATRTIDLDGNEEQEAKRVLAQHLAEQEVSQIIMESNVALLALIHRAIPSPPLNHPYTNHPLRLFSRWMRAPMGSTAALESTVPSKRSPRMVSWIPK